MANLTIRNLPDDVHRALKLRAKQIGRSLQAEVGEILTDAVMPAARVRLGDLLSAQSRALGLTNEDFEMLEQSIKQLRAGVSLLY